MELCSAEFYVARAKISGMFNHRAFWNKLNIYRNAWQKKKWRSLGIQNQAALLNLWVSVYWFIWDLFLIFCFLCRTLRWFPNHFGPRERRLFIYVVLSGILPLLPQTIPSRSLSCLAWSSSPLSHLPTGQKISAVLKTSKCNRTWSNMQQCHHAPKADSRQIICTMMSLCSYSMCSFHLEYFHPKWDL